MDPHKAMANNINRNLRESFNTGKTRDYNSRVRRLRTMKQLLITHEPEALAAAFTDMQRPAFQAKLGYSTVISNIDFILANLKDWMKPEYRDISGLLAPSSNYVIH